MAVGFVFAYITGPSKKVVEKISRRLLEMRLIACANILPVNSIYCWKGKIMEEKEFVMILKTTGAKFGKVKKEVEKMHPYGIPCIIKIPASPNKKYFDWLKKEIKK